MPKATDTCPTAIAEGYDYDCDDEELLCDECGHMLCADCAAHLRYNLITDDYEHADPAAPSCFLVSEEAV